MAEQIHSPFAVDKEVLPDGSITIVTVTGDLDAHTSKLLQVTLNELLDTGHCKIVIDLGGVNYMSSSGAGLFIVTQEEAQEAAGDIILFQPTSAVRYVLDLLGLSAQFRIAETKEAALAALK